MAVTATCQPVGVRGTLSGRAGDTMVETECPQPVGTRHLGTAERRPAALRVNDPLQEAKYGY